MMEPFHISLRVRDLARTRAFYTDVLGCRIGREQPDWLDVDFFGHQVTLHRDVPRDADRHVRGGRGRAGQALDHFGLHLEADDWRALRSRLERSKADFRVKPVVRDAGKDTENGKLVVVDPDGFGLEFKYGSPAAKRPKERLVYVELKSDQDDRGPAWIGRAVLSKSGRTVYFNGLALKRTAGGGVSGNHVCTETGDEYWVSGPKQDGSDRHWAGSGSVKIDERVVDEYLALRGLEALDPAQYEVVSGIQDTDRERFHLMENTPSRRPERDVSGVPGAKEWLVITASRCLIDGVPAPSLDVSVHYCLAASEKEARARMSDSPGDSYRNDAGEQVTWELVEILAVEEFGRVRSGDEVVGFIAELDELTDLASG